MMNVDISKNILKIVFYALFIGTIGIWLRCSGAEIYRFLLVHSRKNILYEETDGRQVERLRSKRGSKNMLVDHLSQ